MAQSCLCLMAFHVKLTENWKIFSMQWVSCHDVCIAFKWFTFHIAWVCNFPKLHCNWKANWLAASLWFCCHIDFVNDFSEFANSKYKLSRQTLLMNYEQQMKQNSVKLLLIVFGALCILQLNGLFAAILASHYLVNLQQSCSK